jgi:hypothetical protein
MDVGALVSAFAGAQAAQLQLAVAARMLRMNAEAAADAVKIIEAAQSNMTRLANVSAGIGANLDVTV